MIAEQLVQIVGALLILTAYGAVQVGRMESDSVRYLVLNLVGSAVLAVLALHHSQWGFLLLEGVWAIISARSLALALHRPAA